MQWFENVLDNEDYEYVLNKTLLGNEWSFSGISNSDSAVKEGFIFWFQNLSETPFFNDNFLSVIENLTNKKFEIIRVYANGQTYGQPGTIHTDIYDDVYAPELYYTFLYYVNPVWDAHWGGQTIVIDENGTVNSVFPSRNTACIFPSVLKHLGSEPSRHCGDLRVTVAFKLKEII
jgi:hypothetical protein